MFKDDISLEIRKLHLIIKREFEKDGNEKNRPTRLQLAILIFIRQNNLDNKPTYQKDIEKQFEIRASTVTEILHKMESDNLIKKESEKTDARLKRIVLTKKADDLQEKLCDRFISIRDQLKKGLTKEEISQYITITRKIQQNLMEMNNDKTAD